MSDERPGFDLQTLAAPPFHNKALPEGALLREWRLEKILGVGGFGIVYRAKDVYFGESVAIKEYFPSAISDRLDGATVTPTDSASEAVYALGLEKFVEEAKVLWNLSKPERHPNIVSVRSLFEINGTAYMVMDFETGVALSQLLREGQRFDEQSLLGLLKPIAQGLDRAHQAGVLHRDIKPANILIDDTGRPVLIDFGSARFESGQATSTQVTFYTPPYAALEQYVKTYPQGPWTDIYALGVALYQCVSGEKPPEVLERLHGGLGEALSARPRPGFSRAFTRAIDAAMAIRPSDRPQSIPEWLALFEQRVCADDEATRIVGVAPATDEAARIAAFEPKPFAQGALAQTEADLVEGAPTARRWIIPVGGFVLLIMAGAAGALLLARAHSPAPRGRDPAAIARIAYPTQPTVRVAAAAPVLVPPALRPAADALVADARRQDRPSGEISALVEARARLNDLSAQIGAATDASTAASLLAALNRQATVMAQVEAKAVATAGQARRREVGRRLGQFGEGTAAVRSAQDQLDSTVAAVAGAQDSVIALNGARQSLSDYAALSRAADLATRQAAPAKRAAFIGIAERARAEANQIISLSSVPRPWLFASRVRKQNYQALQSDAAQAKGLLTELSALSPGGSDVNRLDAAVGKASEIRRELARLAASTSAIARDNGTTTP